MLSKGLGWLIEVTRELRPVESVLLISTDTHWKSGIFFHYPCPGMAATRLIKAFQHHSVWDFHQGQFHVSQRGNRSDTLTARNSYSLIATYSTSSRLRENPVDFVPLGGFFPCGGKPETLAAGCSSWPPHTDTEPRHKNTLCTYDLNS